MVRFRFVLIPDSKRKTNKFEKNEKTYEKFNRIFKKNIAARISKKKFSPGWGDGSKQFFYFGPSSVLKLTI